MREREYPRRGFAVAVCVMAFLAVAGTLQAEPITSIFIANDAPDALIFDATDGSLTIGADSINVLVDREGNMNEFFDDASLVLTATSLTDQSSGSQAAGSFDSVSFELRDSSDSVLLSGERVSGSNLLYAEAGTLDTMLFSGGFVTITGGSLAADFDVAADLFGFGFNISPGTDTFDALDTDHSGSVKISLLPVPEPTTMLLVAGCAGIVLGRRNRSGR